MSFVNGKKAHPVQKMKAGGVVADPTKAVQKGVSEGVGKGASIKPPFPKAKMPPMRKNKVSVSPQRG